MKKEFLMVLSTILSISAQDLLAVKPANDRLAMHAQARNKPTRDIDTRVKDVNTPNPSAHNIPARDLGTYGEIFPIQEESLLDVIKAKLHTLSESGEWEAHQQTILKRAKEQFNRPPPVRSVHKTVNPKSFTYDPSITVPYDLKDHKGNVFHRQGTRGNPLDTHTFRHPFLFVDGDDSQQVAWAISQHQQADASHKPKIVLVQGAPFELSRKLGLPLYFDQSGVLVKKFGITQIPARVSQKGKVLVVDEVNQPTADTP